MKIKNSRKNRIRLTAIILCALLVLGSSGIVSADTDAAVQSYNDRLADAAAKQAELEEELAEIRSQQSDVWYEIEKYDEIISVATEQKNLAETQLEQINEQIESKTQEIADTEARIERQEQAFLSRMRTIYMEGDASWLEVLAGATSLVDFLTRMDRVVVILQNDKDIIAGLEEDRASLEEAKAALETAYSLQTSTMNDFENTITNISAVNEEKLARITELEANESEALSEYYYAKEQEDEINQELTDYLAQRAEEQRLAREAAEKAEAERQAALAAAQAEAERQAALAAQEAEAANQSAWAASQVDDSSDDTTSSSSSDSGTTYSAQDPTYNEFASGGSWWPLPTNVSYTKSSEYGWRDLWGTSDFHLGVDLACACNTPVYAAAAGEVIVATWHYSYGNYVIIDHGGGITTLYAHMNSIVASVGDYVSSGDLIGYVGMTGSASGYHLHFEVREDGATTNPDYYLNYPY